VFTGAGMYNGYYELLDPNTTTGLKGLAPRNPMGMLMGRDNQSDVYRSITKVMYIEALVMHR